MISRLLFVGAIGGGYLSRSIVGSIDNDVLMISHLLVDVTSIFCNTESDQLCYLKCFLYFKVVLGLKMSLGDVLGVKEPAHILGCKV
jgi:hypothetical protein